MVLHFMCQHYTGILVRIQNETSGQCIILVHMDIGAHFLGAIGRVESMLARVKLRVGPPINQRPPVRA